MESPLCGRLRLAVANMCRNLYSFGVLRSSHTLTVTAASNMGVSGLIRSAEAGDDIIVERHGEPVAAVIAINRLNDIREIEADLRTAALVLTRGVTDNGNRTSLDDVITSFGFTRSELEVDSAAVAAAKRA